jgi:gamma-glutamylcyclotransferase (GGCT)/AIG2-like uncharacterized protein YtfP
MVSLQPKQPPIFVYGTLMSTKMLSWVLTGDSSNYTQIEDQSAAKRLPATLYGYRRVPVKHSDYPAIIPAEPVDMVHGFLVFPSTESQWKKLDDFEGEIYKRTLVRCHCSDAGPTQAGEKGFEVEANVYLWVDDYEKLELDGEWSYDIFEKERLDDWLELFSGMEMVG